MLYESSFCEGSIDKEKRIFLKKFDSTPDCDTLFYYFMLFSWCSKEKELCLMMNVQSKMEGNKLILYVLGEIDHHTAKEIRKEMDKQILSLHPKEIKINLSSVSLMDSSGLGLIMGRYATASDIGAALKEVNPTDSVARIMLMAGLDKIVPIERIK